MSQQSTEQKKVTPQPTPMSLNNINTLVINQKIFLETTFPEDQLHLMAKKDSLVMFMATLMSIFGTDIPAEAYHKLYEDAQAKDAILHPNLIVVKHIPDGGQAQFNSKTEKVSVLKKLVLKALDDNESRGKLMTILIEEYGHYLDYLLRNHYAQVSTPDAEGDEGAKFAYKLYFINPLESSDQYFADARVNGNEHELIWDFSEYHNNLKEYVNEERQNKEDRQDNLEFFKAGDIKPEVHFGHGNIEEDALTPVLISAGVNRKDVRKKIDIIYLGNWLRDFSQAVDPMIVRPMAGAADWVCDDNNNSSVSEDMVSSCEVIDIEKKFTLQVPDGFWNKLLPWKWVKPAYKTIEFRPVTLSVEAITTAIELMATKEFIHAKGPGKSNSKSQKGHQKEEQNKFVKSNIENYDGHLNKLRSEFVPITTDTLGVYRPEEHIDNPISLGHDGSGNNRGDKTVYSKFVGYVSDSSELHKIGRTLGMKNYIRSAADESANFVVDGEKCLTSYQYILKKIREACRPGGLENPKNLVDFGAAMHTFEDYFGHTNYAEIALIKVAEPLVFPWVDEVAETGFKYEYEDLFKGRGLNDKYIIFNDKEKVGDLKGNHRLAAYLPIVTGTFGLVDTAASVMPLINKHLFSIEIKPWEKTKPKERTFVDILVRELLKDLDGAQESDTKSNGKGTNNNNYSKAFEFMLSVRDAAQAVSDFIVPDAIKEGFHWLFQRIKVMLSFTTYFTLKYMGAALNDAQVAMGKDLDAMKAGTFSLGVDPSHTQVGKDDPHCPTHSLTAELSVHAVSRVGQAMADVWQNKGSIEQVIAEIDAIMRHPVETSWQDSIVEQWAKNNKDQLCTAVSPSVLIEALLHSEEEINRIITDMEINIPKIDEVAIGLINRYFEEDVNVKDEITSLKNSLKESRKIYQEQRTEIEKLSIVWDKKFPKPAMCRGVDPHGHNENRTETSKINEADSNGHTKMKTQNGKIKKPEPPVPGGMKTQTHLIKKGDSLWEIARKHGTTVEEIKALNGLSGDKILAGNTLKLPVTK